MISFLISSFVLIHHRPPTPTLFPYTTLFRSITANKVNLNVDWMDDVVTHKAKARIRQFIKQRERNIAREGRELWDKKASRSKLEISDQELTQVAKKFRFDDAQMMFHEIGTGAFDVN